MLDKFMLLEHNCNVDEINLQIYFVSFPFFSLPTRWSAHT